MILTACCFVCVPTATTTTDERCQLRRMDGRTDVFSFSFIDLILFIEFHVVRLCTHTVFGLWQTCNTFLCWLLPAVYCCDSWTITTSFATQCALLMLLLFFVTVLHALRFSWVCKWVTLLRSKTTVCGSHTHATWESERRNICTHWHQARSVSLYIFVFNFEKSVFNRSLIFLFSYKFSWIKSGRRFCVQKWKKE